MSMMQRQRRHKVRRRSGTNVKLVRLAHEGIEADTAYVVWSRHDDYRLGRYVPVADVRCYVMVAGEDGGPQLSKYAVTFRKQDGRLLVGGALARYDLRLRAAQKGSPAYLDRKKDEVAARVAAAIEKHRLDLHQDPMFAMPEPYYGYGGTLQLTRSTALTGLARTLHGLPPDAPVGEEQLRAAWKAVPSEAYRTPEGKAYVLYPARYVAPEDGRDYEVHPRTGSPAPAEPAPLAFTMSGPDWAAIDGRWVPTMVPGYVVFLPGAKLAGVGYPNPAFKVLSEYAITYVSESDFEKDPAGAAARLEAEIKAQTPLTRIELKGVICTRLPKAPFTLNDCVNALLRPQEPIVATEEPRIRRISRFDLAAPARWYSGSLL